MKSLPSMSNRPPGRWRAPSTGPDQETHIEKQRYQPIRGSVGRPDRRNAVELAAMAALEDRHVRATLVARALFSSEQPAFLTHSRTFKSKVIDDVDLSRRISPERSSGIHV
jgi:hypothetical protein